ncbi:MAG: Response regulator UvrY [Flavobacteriales bacterium]|jgi:DNA-binding NarL/FixJ family response regulator|nr:MAG: DNA-binding response regulator [Flavobacteriales bacterium]CAI8254874.1 MAG: Response regulator UvrY [Flavobacteriales bacterium]|tara:strand:+ start:350 stop:985 length:636 start_codon:yes stop_codon:yes gene_type:complete
MIRVYVADAHPIIYKGIKAVFRNSTEIDIVGKGLHYRELFDFLNAKKVNVVLLELELPGFEGIHLIQELKEMHPKVRFMIFSNLKEEIYAINSLKAGASGYLCKTNPLSRLREAILKISSGGVYITNELAELIAFKQTGANPISAIEKLSRREIQVLRLLINGRKNTEIALALGISDKTVSTYRTRIMKKLNVSNIIDLARKTQDVDLDLY